MWGASHVPIFRLCIFRIALTGYRTARRNKLMRRRLRRRLINLCLPFSVPCPVRAIHRLRKWAFVGLSQPGTLPKDPQCHNLTPKMLDVHQSQRKVREFL